MNKEGKITFGKSDHAHNHSAAYKNAKHFSGFQVGKITYKMKSLQQNQSVKTTTNYHECVFLLILISYCDDYRLRHNLNLRVGPTRKGNKNNRRNYMTEFRMSDIRGKGGLGRRM